MKTFFNKLYAPMLLLFTVSGCATLSPDHGFTTVQQAAAKLITQDVQWPKNPAEQALVQARVDALLKNPLDVEAAVQLALLNNHDLQASYYALGISDADLAQAGRLPNPRFSMLYASKGGDYKIEQVLVFNILALISMPRLKAIEQRRFEQTRQSVILEILRLAYNARQAFFDAVAARQGLGYSEQVRVSAEASAELAQRMVQAGNWSELAEAREQGFYADAVLENKRAKRVQSVANEQLLRVLGLNQTELKLAERLPDLPGDIQTLPAFETSAIAQRLDLQALRLETEALAQQLGFTKATRFINVLELGPARVLEGKRGDAYKNGIDISFELPLFDWGEARVARAEAIYMQSVKHTAQAVINAQSEVREAYARYQSSYAIAKQYRDEIIPLRKRVLHQNQLRYNGMLTSPFELFADARAQVAGVNAYIASLRDFWQAENVLTMSLLGTVKSESNSAQGAE